MINLFIDEYFLSKYYELCFGLVDGERKVNNSIVIFRGIYSLMRGDRYYISKF